MSSDAVILRAQQHLANHQLSCPASALVWRNFPGAIRDTTEVDRAITSISFSKGNSMDVHYACLLLQYIQWKLVIMSDTRIAPC